MSVVSSTPAPILSASKLCHQVWLSTITHLSITHPAALCFGGCVNNRHTESRCEHRLRGIYVWHPAQCNASNLWILSWTCCCFCCTPLHSLHQSTNNLSRRSYKLSSTTVSLDSPPLTLTSQISGPALICTCQLVWIGQGDCSICGQLGGGGVIFTDDTWQRCGDIAVRYRQGALMFRAGGWGNGCLCWLWTGRYVTRMTPDHSSRWPCSPDW